ncbi:GFA family protein [Bordetella bronchialis]|uniref:Aldehyde-activating protein n=1 Tax=Bordetella bronchialis TaxID=463025 RepID=A0A193FHS2_9BORD|nr:GFA family protein [Bordetella bronchialis]ANN67287.1 aldehyde-activating protein [Bordetella bronchialis]ANN72376.1 aldehyde-activating protein [Bordetella bronchialis]
MRVQGQCHCGAIVYQAEVDPATVAICHCIDCQRLSGGIFRVNIPAPAETFRIVKGEPRRYIKTADSGARRVHAFCENCGSPVYSSAVENPKSYSLRLGALDQRDRLGYPSRQIWTKRRIGWMPPLDDVPAVEGQP